MRFQLLESDLNNSCEHIPEHVVLNVTGGFHFSCGDVSDDIKESFICLDCWEDVIPVSEPDNEPVSEIPF